MSWLQDAKYAARSLRKSPGFTLVAAVTLALGVGANAAIFSVVNAVMLRPLPFASPDRLVRVWESNVERGWPTFAASHPNFLDWRSRSKSFASLAAMTNAGFTWMSGGDAEVVQGLNVTATFLRTLQVTPALGRNFLDEEDRPGGNTRVVIVTDGFWRRALGSDPNAIGRSLTLNGLPYTVIGVLPPSFRWGGDDTGMLAPLAPDPARNRSDHRLSVIGRLADDVSIEQATSELSTLAANLQQQFPESNKGWGIRTATFYDWLVPESTRRSLLILLGAVGLVLLIACGNVVNLLLARGAGRQRELSIRAAMGASQARVVRQMLFESALIALIAAAIAIGLAFAAMQLLIALGPSSVPRLGELSIDLRVVSFAITVALGTMVIFGLLPAIQAARHDPQDALRADSRGSTSGAGRRRIRAALTIAEVALSVALLIGAGLLIRSFSRLQQVEPGFRVAGTGTARFNLPNSIYQGGAAKWAFQQRMLDDLRGRPGIEAAAISSGPPLTGDFTSGDLRLPSQSKEQAGSTAWRLVSPGYFATLGIPLRGRDFSAQDGEKSPLVAIISAAIAAKYFPNEDPIGRPIIMGSFSEQPHTIIGVAGDVRTFGLDQDAGFVFYGSTSQYTGWNPMTLVWRAQGPALDAVRASVRSLDARVPLSSVLSMEELIEDSFGPRRFNLYLLGAFAAIALALAAIGLFGVMAYLVSQRTREIGVRLALGATRGEVFRLILGRGMTLAGIGAAIGIGAALWLTRVMESLLFSVSRTDPVTFIAVPTTLIAVAAIACYLPARRAMKVDPVNALRADG
ncbi:MAG TPA: ABC transporter permease [Vicinamibacterales bacterium]|nr:ABC transporter permease [Vicinamibacterales bacterium]